MKLEEIAKLCAEATPGPWIYGHCGEDDDEQFYDWFVENERVVICRNDATNHVNGKFIAASRDLLPKLLRIALLVKANNIGVEMLHAMEDLEA